MRSSTTSGHKHTNNPYLLSLCTALNLPELAAELQAAEAMLDSCNAQNQHLTDTINGYVKKFQNRSVRFTFGFTG